MSKPAKDVNIDKLAAQQEERLKEKEDKKMASAMPKPSGYKILIALPEPEKATAGGILKAKETLHTEEIGSVCGFVMELGPDAYKDKEKFPTGAWCKKGDWIIMRTYSGTRIKVHGKEFRLLNDDSVEAVVSDPRGIVKV